MSLSDDLAWWENFRASDGYRRLQDRPVAYFCAEFALTSSLKTYSGGLGVLAGDILREAADQKLPLVGVGLLYGESIAGRSPTGPATVEPVLAAGTPLTVRVPIQDRYVTVAAYRYPSTKIGAGWWSGGVRTAPVYFLTTDCPGNDPRDCCLTDKLYPADKEKRLQQEIILGLGGLRLLEALAIHPSIYHLNEGHSAFLALEIIRHEMSERLIGFDDALNLARRHVVFTNHTLVPAGQDVYSNDLVAANLAKYAEELAVPVDRLVNLGLVQESSLFSMTMLSLRLAGKINAVSQLHAAKAGEIWKDHPMEGITNGIHLGTWDRLSDIQTSHLVNKRHLLEKIKSVTGHDWPEDCLLLGWARRFVGYKRPLSIFFDPVWLADICSRPNRPVRIIISGNVQEEDEEGEKLLAELKNLLNFRQSDFRQPDNQTIRQNSPAVRQSDSLNRIAAYLSNYGMELAQLLTAGCDVWLNTPIVGFEACGTSGMKAALNGVLPISTKDGWMAEIDPLGIGWLLDSDKVSDSLYRTLENQVIPLYFDHRQEWLKNMVSARRLILENFTTTRVLKEYIEKLYLPLIS